MVDAAGDLRLPARRCWPATLPLRRTLPANLRLPASLGDGLGARVRELGEADLLGSDQDVRLTAGRGDRGRAGQTLGAMIA